MMADQETSKLEDGYKPPDIKYIESVLRTIAEVAQRYGGSNILVARPCKMPTCLLDAVTMSPEAGRTETAYDALQREVPRLMAELDVVSRHNREMLALLRDMAGGSSIGGASTNGVGSATVLDAYKGHATCMVQSVRREQIDRADVRLRMRLRGEFSEG